MSIKKKKQLSIILILSVISALMLSQPVKASDDNFENDWKYPVSYTHLQHNKFFSRSKENLKFQKRRGGFSMNKKTQKKCVALLTLLAMVIRCV